MLPSDFGLGETLGGKDLESNPHLDTSYGGEAV